MNFVTIHVPRSIFVITFLFDFAFIGGIRFSYRIYRRWVKGEFFRGKSEKRILILGAGDAGASIVKEMKFNPALMSKPVAILDDDPRKKNKKLNSVPIVGSTSKIVEAVKKYNVEEIIIAIPTLTNIRLNELFNECAKTHCKVKLLPSVSQLIGEKVIMQKVKDVDIEDLLGRAPIALNNTKISSYITEKVVVVTGGGGSIGSELCRQIAAYNPKKLIIIDNYENNAFEIQNELQYKFPELKLDTIIANVREKHRIDSIFRQHKPQIVFHAAAHKHVPLMEHNPCEAIKNNVIGTQNVSESAHKHNAEKFVLISTDKAVNPTNIMGATKRLAEMYIQALDSQSETEFVAVRFGNVLGSNGSVIPYFKKQIEQGGPVTVTHPEINRFFMTIPEAVQLVLQAGSMAEGGEIFVLDMGKPVKIVDLARNLIRLSGFEPDVDIKIEFSGLRPGEKLYEELLMDEEGLKSTENNKIFVAKPLFTDLAMLRREIDVLKETIMLDKGDVFELVKTLVPTYKKAQ